MNRRVLVSRLVATFCAAELLRPSKGDSQESTARDGTWWQQLPASNRLIFVVGFMDGMDLGKDFSYWGITDSEKNCLRAVYSSYTEMEKRHFSNVTAGHQARDSRNRNRQFHTLWRSNRSI